MKYQDTGAEFLANRRIGFLCDDPGLGKSRQAVLAADRIGARKLTVVCPAIARENWRRELERWQTIPRTIQVVGSARDAKDLTADVVIVSYGLVRTLHCGDRGSLALTGHSGIWPW